MEEEREILIKALNVYGGRIPKKYELLKEIEKLQDRIERANNYIDQVIMYIVKPEDYNKIETLQDILNGNEFGSDKE